MHPLHHSSTDKVFYTAHAEKGHSDMKDEKTTKNQAPALSAEALEARRAYYREWRKKNPEKCAEYRRRRWERKAARGAANE